MATFVYPAIVVIKYAAIGTAFYLLPQVMNLHQSV